MKNFVKVTLTVVFSLLLLGVGGFTYYVVSGTAEAAPQALNALESTTAVEVSSGDWLTFTPTAQSPTTAFIFYSGGLVERDAYAPQLHAIAAEGYLVIAPELLLNLAFFDSNAAAEIISAYPEIETWAIGGHSLGGVAAAQFASEHPDLIDGLALWASYPNGDLSDQQLAVVSIYGTADGLVSQEDLDTSRANLPASAEFVAIEGGNHAQFGSYGPQDGDNPAQITTEEQLAEITAVMSDFLSKIGR